MISKIKMYSPGVNLLSVSPTEKLNQVKESRVDNVINDLPGLLNRFNGINLLDNECKHKLSQASDQVDNIMGNPSFAAKYNSTTSTTLSSDSTFSAIADLVATLMDLYTSMQDISTVQYGKITVRMQGISNVMGDLNAARSILTSFQNAFSEAQQNKDAKAEGIATMDDVIALESFQTSMKNLNNVAQDSPLWKSYERFGIASKDNNGVYSIRTDREFQKNIPGMVATNINKSFYNNINPNDWGFGSLNDMLPISEFDSLHNCKDAASIDALVAAVDDNKRVLDSLLQREQAQLSTFTRDFVQDMDDLGRNITSIVDRFQY